jgi:hypothetical protein
MLFRDVTKIHRAQGALLHVFRAGCRNVVELKQAPHSMHRLTRAR